MRQSLGHDLFVRRVYRGFREFGNTTMSGCSFDFLFHLVSLYDKLKKKFFLGDVTFYFVTGFVFSSFEKFENEKNVETAMMNTLFQLENFQTGKQKKLFKILENDDKNINATDGGIGVVR